ncbi:MAG: hypothetical protein QOF67_3366 [Mycobacterium sp.]|nr:hypothetical protein [Mycobacterium sp.]
MITEGSPKTTGRRRIAVGDSAARCHGSGSYTSAAVSHSSDRSAGGFPFDCWSDSHRCGPTRMRVASQTTRRFRRRLRNSRTERRPDTSGCSDRGRWRRPHRLTRATASYRCRAGPTPDMHCCSRSSGCASRVANRNRDTVSCERNYERLPTRSCHRVEPPIGIEPMTFRLQGERSTTELRRPAGSEFIGSPVREVRCP